MSPVAKARWGQVLRVTGFLEAWLTGDAVCLPARQGSEPSRGSLQLTQNLKTLALVRGQILSMKMTSKENPKAAVLYMWSPNPRVLGYQGLHKVEAIVTTSA